MCGRMAALYYSCSLAVVRIRLHNFIIIITPIIWLDFLLISLMCSLKVNWQSMFTPNSLILWYGMHKLPLMSMFMSIPLCLPIFNILPYLVNFPWQQYSPLLYQQYPAVCSDQPLHLHVPQTAGDHLHTCIYWTPLDKLCQITVI